MKYKWKIVPVKATSEMLKQFDENCDGLDEESAVRQWESILSKAPSPKCEEEDIGEVKRYRMVVTFGEGDNGSDSFTFQQQDDGGLVQFIDHERLVNKISFERDRYYSAMLNHSEIAESFDQGRKNDAERYEKIISDLHFSLVDAWRLLSNIHPDNLQQTRPHVDYVFFQKRRELWAQQESIHNLSATECEKLKN